MNRPVFFLSSTIYDFHDLRSAVKYYLEQQGCRVLASDHNDFVKPLDPHSYEACIKAIGDSDYFILLIGNRAGGWVEHKKVSITQAEYREAYRLHRQGRLKLLNFVRADVWQLREERKGLRNHLKAIELAPEAKAGILNHANKFADDPEFIISFIDEVAKNKETAAAAKGQGPFPTGNWLHVFRDFNDVIEQIQVQAFAGRPIEEIAMLRLLRQELKGFLRMSLPMHNGSVLQFRRSIDEFYVALPETLTIVKDESMVETRTFDNLCWLWMTTINVRYYPIIIPRALASSIFMDFDHTSGGMVERPVYNGLLELAREIELFQLTKTGQVFEFFAKTSPNFRGPVGKHMVVNTGGLMGLLHSVDRWHNVIELCRAVIRYIDGKEYVRPNLRPRIPHGTDEKLDKTLASGEQTEAFVNLSLPM